MAEKSPVPNTQPLGVDSLENKGGRLEPHHWAFCAAKGRKEAVADLVPGKDIFMN